MKNLTLLIALTLVLAACQGPTLLYEQDETLLTTNVFVAIRSGARNDPMDKVGVTSLMAELLLRGTKNRTRTQFQQEIERLGGSLGVGVGATMIQISGTVIRENTEPFLKLLEDAILNATFLQTEFDALKKEVNAGILYAKNHNMSLASLAMRRVIYEGTPLARPVSGSLTTLKNIKREDVIAQYKKVLHKGNIFFGVTSALPKKVFKSHLLGISEKIPDGKQTEPNIINPKFSAKNQLILVDKAKTETGTVLMAQEGIVAKDPERFPLGIGNFSFGAVALTARLFKVIRADLGWTYFIRSTYTGIGSMSDQKSVYMIRSTPAIEHTTNTIYKVLDMWQEYMEKGLDEKELSLAHESLVNSYPFRFDSAQKRLAMKSRSYIYDIPILDPDEYKKKIEGYKQKHIIDAIQKHHQDQHWTVVIVADKRTIEKQLKKANKKLPKDQQLTVTKTFKPEDVIQ